MAYILVARGLCLMNSRQITRQTLSYQSRSEMLKIIQRFKYTRPASLKQKPRSKASFKFTGLMEGGYILLVFPAVCVFLGTWQVSRRKWKLGLLEKIDKRIDQPPIPLPENLDELAADAKELEYTRYIFRGRYLYDKEAVIAPRSNLNEDYSNRNQTRLPGVHMVTPFKLAGREETILVNRGWLNTDQFKDMRYRRNGQVEEEIEIVGLLRADDKRNQWTYGFDISTPSNEATFMTRDIESISKVLGTTPLFMDATELRLKPGAPLGGQTRISLPNNHGTYVFTWYGLAIATLWLWFDKYRRSNVPKNVQSVLEMQKRWNR